MEKECTPEEAQLWHERLHRILATDYHMQIQYADQKLRLSNNDESVDMDPTDYLMLINETQGTTQMESIMNPKTELGIFLTTHIRNRQIGHAAAN